MITRLIKTIRRQPKGVRNQVALGIATVFTASVFTVWLYHAPAKYAAISDIKNESPSLFGQITEKIGSQLSSLKSAAEDPVGNSEESLPVTNIDIDTNPSANINTDNNFTPASYATNSTSSVSDSEIKDNSTSTRTIRIVTSTSTTEI